MRYFGHRSVPYYPIASDVVATFLLAANTGQSMAFPAGTDLARVTFATTAGAALAGVVNWSSTSAAWGTSFGASGASTTHNIIVQAGYDKTFQFARNIATTASSFSVIAPAAGVCCVEFWSRAGAVTS